MDYYGTIGPSCADREVLKQMKAAGMTGLRMNLSHGSLAEHEDWLDLIREAEVEQLLINLQGPELRIGELEQPLALEADMWIRLISKDDGKREKDIGIPCPDSVIEALLRAETGQQILLDDGKILLQMHTILKEDSLQKYSADEKAAETGEQAITEDSLRKYPADDRETSGSDQASVPGAVRCGKREAQILCQVLRGGVLLGRKSIALPGLTVDSPTLTEADHENLKMAKASGVTGVMLPFVRGREDILTLRETLKNYGAESIHIFAKIENLAGVRSLPEFVGEVDHVVIARGDLGNAMPLWELPGCQKRIAAICRNAGTPFMVVTQMLDSMYTRAVPTRAEVSDIYNAVLDGAASVMLTGETAAGQYPVDAMKYLVKTGECAVKDSFVF